MSSNIKLSDYDFTDLQNYPNVGKNSKGKLVEFSYNNNATLRGENDNLFKTPLAREEYAKCKGDIEYFIRTYVKINTLTGIVPFNMFDYQRELLDLTKQSRFVIAMIARQMGKTTIASAIVLHELVFNKSYYVGITAQTDTQVLSMMSMVKDMYQMLPPFLQKGVKVWNTKTVELEDKRVLAGFVAGESAFRGKSVNRLVIDEKAFINNTKWNGLKDSAYPSITSSKTSKIIIISTPNGIGNHFHEDYIKAHSDIKDASDGEFVSYVANWTRNPTRDKDWADKELDRIGELLFNQNHLCSFIGSSETLVKPATLKTLNTNDDYVINEYVSEHFKVWEEFIYDDKYKYVVSVDSARTSAVAKSESDANAIIVVRINTETMRSKVVAVYHGKDVHYTELAYLIENVLELYPNALLIIENNSEGSGILTQINELVEDANIFSHTVKWDEFGFRTTSKSRKSILSNIAYLIDNGMLEISDVEIENELITFVKNKNGRYEALPKKHDDLVMALAINFAWLLEPYNSLDIDPITFLSKNGKNNTSNQTLHLHEDTPDPSIEEEEFDILGANGIV